MVADRATAGPDTSYTRWLLKEGVERIAQKHVGLQILPEHYPYVGEALLGAIKAVSAASLALRGDGQHLVSLDACIRTM